VGDIVNEQKDWLGRGWAYPTEVDPETGSVAVAEYEIDIRQAILIILETSRGERVMRPDFGCGIHDLVFATIDVATLTRIESEVRESLIKYEARVEVTSVRADPFEAANGLLLIELEYRVHRTNQIGNLVYPFYFREAGVGLVRVSRG
jgi:phage baseplate assembly protein W